MNLKRISGTALVSVIVPILNAGQTLEACLLGLLQQDFRDFEVLLIDNGSHDHSRQIAESFAQSYPQLPIRLLHQPERGSYAARNLGVEHSGGQVLAFLDPDCVPVKSWLSTLVRTLQEPQVQIAMGHRQFPPGSMALQLIAAYEETKDRTVLNDSDARVYFGYTSNLAMWRSTFQELGPFSHLARGADTLFVRRTVERFSTQSVLYCGQAQVRHLEVTDLQGYYRKVYLYGFYRARDCSSVPLNTAKRWLIFQLARRQYQLNFAKSLYLLFLPQELMEQVDC